MTTDSPDDHATAEVFTFTPPLDSESFPPAPDSIPQLATVIKDLLRKTDQMASRVLRDIDMVWQRYRQTGMYLQKLKSLKPEGISWADFVEGRCGIKRRRADQLIELAEGRVSLDEIRAQAAQRMRRHRDRQRGRNVTPSPRQRAHREQVEASPAEPVFRYLTDAKGRLCVRMNGAVIARWKDGRWYYLGADVDCVIEEVVRIGDTWYPIEDEPELEVDAADEAEDDAGDDDKS